MLSIILKILSILGIILLVLLGLILIILLLVLFFPICYRIKADKQSAPDIQDSTDSAPGLLIHADAKAWWLFGLLRARYQYPEPGTLRVKLLFFTLYDSGTNTQEDYDIESESETEDNLNISEASESVTSPSPTQTKTSAQSEATEAEETQSNLQNNNLFEKIQYTIRKLYDKIKKVFVKAKEIRNNIAYYKEILTAEDTKELLKHVLMRLGKIFKSLRPRKLRANICYGADSPDTTGYVCAVYGMIAHHLGKHVVFTPDFENEIFEGDLYAAGHTTVFLLLWNLLMLLKDKRLWELRDKMNQKP